MERSMRKAHEESKTITQWYLGLEQPGCRQRVWKIWVSYTDNNRKGISTQKSIIWRGWYKAGIRETETEV